ncbi:sulfurtransferase [Cellulophaga sp. E16_2]|uniref:sulfurtransferase n=1 Tax=Cellulophaga sp. E16_2 TaxID=2789297 RepID=UPI001A9379F0|nr:sulfurtransferase [Cellulophaga sp. E16_2]MBO0590043.1 sulfurtransferase [Cellulophaga sp. E16_2]
MDSLVTVDWLKNHLNDSDLVILDASASDIISGNVPELDTVKIVGARVFDLKNDFSDTTSLYPNTLLSPEDFELACQSLGINKTSKIIVYDNLGVYWSPRVWWLFKAMGHVNIAVLDGGLPEWLAEGFPVEVKKFKVLHKGDFKASLNNKMIVGFLDVLENTKSEDAVLIDARSSGRFSGSVPEPRKDLRGGCIPNSINIPYQSILNEGKYKPISELKTIFKELKQEERPLVFSCGSGVTACILLLASELVGTKNKKSVYDGSWTEWAQKVL